ncbi:MAG: pyridoxamine 5'-phosphate oxidase [Hyphomicrobiaceae bacterium]|nr:pyridoxamine 5'-phosphate oxidase [Hyphomicrobiaceae bacterium]
MPDYPAPDFFGETDPFALFDVWFAEATAAEVNDPNAMALATVDRSGLPNVRVVLLKGIDSFDVPRRGFVFYTNTESAKGQELLSSGKAALNFHWKSLRRQIRIRGSVARVPDAEADAYYATRPRGSRIGAWASQQSRPLESRTALESEIARLEARHPGDIPRPPHWTGFRLTPAEIEFWCERRFRLHDRLVFSRPTPATAWTRNRLYP